MEPSGLEPCAVQPSAACACGVDLENGHHRAGFRSDPIAYLEALFYLFDAVTTVVAHIWPGQQFRVVVSREYGVFGAISIPLTCHERRACGNSGVGDVPV